MIDYDKLKLAHELILKVDEKYAIATHAACTFDTYYRLYAQNCDWFEDYESIDELIAKLEELTESKPKYKIGDIVWFVILAREWLGIETEIDAIDDNKYHVSYGHWMHENELYPTKAALIEAQIEYWISLREVQPGIKGTTGPMELYPPKECQHESDGSTWLLEMGKHMKCLKCGEFYR